MKGKRPLPFYRAHVRRWYDLRSDFANHSPEQRIRARQRLICLLAVVLALTLRIALILHTNGVIDGDEALVGIQAQHIVGGERPVYFYGQPYMGSLEAYLMACIFALFGSSVWTLRSEPLLLSLFVVWLTSVLAGRLADSARLTDTNRFLFVTIATLLAAVAPLYATVQELRALGGYIELYVLILLLLLATLGLTRRWSTGMGWREALGHWAGIGFLLGLGFWVNPLLLSAVMAMLLWLGGYLIISLARQHASGKLSVFLRRSALYTLCAIALLPSFALGSAPALVWGSQNHWANVYYLLNRGGSTSIGSFTTLLGNYTECVSGHIIGGMMPGESLRLFLFLHLLPLTIGLLSIGTSIFLVGYSLKSHQAWTRQARWLVGLPLLFGLCNAIMFCIGTSPVSCPSDALGRYAAPLMLVMPFICAGALVSLLLYLRQRSDTSQTTRRDETSISELAGEESQDAASSSDLIHTNSRGRQTSLIQKGLIALLMLSLCTQATSYLLTNPGTAFQSPSCLIAPANNDPLITYMKNHGIHYAWGIIWIGQPINFKEQGRIIVAEPRFLFVGQLGSTPEFVKAVLAADRPSLLSFVRHTDLHPQLEQVLDTQGVRYHSARFPSQPGFDVLLVTPLNKTFSPLQLPASQTVFVPCGITMNQ